MIKHLAAAIALALSTGAMAGTSTFNSAAEFSGTQGTGGWTYGYYAVPDDASSFTPFAFFDAASNPQWWEQVQTQGPWTLLWDTGGHPDIGLWAVRRWTSAVEGTLDFGIQYQQESAAGATGVHVLVDGVRIYDAYVSTTLGTQSFSRAVGVGSTVDFAIDALDSQANDSTRFTAQGYVTAVPEPESYALMLAGLGVLGAVARRSRKA